MTAVQAWQHIYSNVEKEQSPAGRGGFQTLFYTISGLSEAEIDEMEGRLLYFASQTEPVKHLFFSTSSGKAAVSQIVSLPAPDQFGRGGRYLAHSLVFGAEALVQFEVDPFRVFRQFSFVTTIAEALSRGDFRTQNIPVVSLELPASLASDVSAAQAWPAGELKKLALLALRAGQHHRNREAITFTGDPQLIENALAAAYLAVPAVGRARLSFDTYFHRCNLVATYFWAIGLPEPAVSIKVAHVECNSRRVEGKVPTQLATAYECWALQNIEDGQLDLIANFRDRAYALGEWLEGRDNDPDLLDTAPPQLIKQLFEASPRAVQDSVRRGLAQKLPAALVERAADHQFRHVDSQELYWQLRQGFELPQLLDGLYESYAGTQFEEPSRREVKALETVLALADHKRIGLVLAYWSGSRKRLGEALQGSEDTDYRQFVKIVLSQGLVEPLQLIVPGQGDAFLDLYLAGNAGDLPHLAEKLLETGQAGCLARLAEFIPDARRTELGKLGKLTQENPATPEPFRRAVTEAIGTLPPEPGLGAKIKLAFRRLSGG